MARSLKTKQLVNAFATAMNPLKGLTQTGIESLIEWTRRGNDVRLQLAYHKMERCTPIFGICLNKRLNGIANRKWDIVPIYQTEDAKRQADAVKTMFLEADSRNLDGLTEALRHLGLAAFRGRAVVKPFFDDDGKLYFKKIPNWNTLEWNDKLYYNPESDLSINFVDGNANELPILTEDEICWIKDDRPIDIPGLQVYLRQLIGEENWARFIEKEGVPQVILTTPENTPDSALEIWNLRALSIFEGGSGVLPGGSKIDMLTSGRGQDPFTSYCDHQMETIVLLALGEKMTTLGGSAGLGSNLAEIQSQEFNDLVTYDCKRIANAMSRCTVRKCIKHLGYSEQLCRFEYIEQDNTTPEQYLNLAKQAKDLGLTVDVSKLKELTKLSFISDFEKDIWTPEKKDDPL